MEPAADQPILAIDLGGTQIRAAIVTPRLEVVARRAVATRDEEGVDAVVSRIGDLAAAVREEGVRLGAGSPVGVGISSPGPLDPWRGIVVAPPNLAGWREVRLADAVASALDAPTFLERDTNVAVMAEWRFGAARGAAAVVYITVSTGVGGGIVIDGRLLQGIDGTAGEIGHLTVDLDGPLCGDGMPGHLEAIASGTGIANRARERLDAGGAPALRRLLEEGGELDAELVARAADAGDADSRAILDRAWVALGAACAGLVNLLNPEVIVIGGSIAEHRPRLFEMVRAEIERRAFPLPARRVRLERAHFGPDVSLIGSLPIVTQRLHDPAYRRGGSEA